VYGTHHRQILVAICAQAEPPPTAVERLLHLPLRFDSLGGMEKIVFVKRDALVMEPPLGAEHDVDRQHLVGEPLVAAIHVVSPRSDFFAIHLRRVYYSPAAPQIQASFIAPPAEALSPLAR